MPCHFQAAPALAPQLAVGSSPRQGCTDFSRRIAPSQNFQKRLGKWNLANFLWLKPPIAFLGGPVSLTPGSCVTMGKNGENLGKNVGKICKSGELRLGLPTPVRWSGNKFCASLFTWLYLPRGPRGSLSKKIEWQRSRTKEPVIHDVEDALEAEATQMRADPRMEDGSIWIKPSHQHPSTTSVHSLQLAWMY